MLATEDIARDNVVVTIGTTVVAIEELGGAAGTESETVNRSPLPQPTIATDTTTPTTTLFIPAACAPTTSMSNVNALGRDCRKDGVSGIWSERPRP